MIREEEEKQALLDASATSSTTPTKPNRNRRHRPSFRGLSIIDESKSGCMKPAQIGAIKVRSNRASRRRKTLDVLSATAASTAVRNIIDDTDTMGSILKGLVLEGTPEERLQAVLTKAKERGLSAEKIFSFFTGTDPSVLEITRESFLQALEKLGNTIIVLSDDELTDLVKKFDTGEYSWCVCLLDSLGSFHSQINLLYLTASLLLLPLLCFTRRRRLSHLHR